MTGVIAAPSLPSGYRLLAFDTIGSTNDEARRLARAAGQPGGTVIWAGEQTSGRGRRGRFWSSPPGNLYVSLLLRPGGSAAAAAQLGFVAALGLGDALHEIGGPALAVRCKWPNDLLLGDGRKVAGILLESETSAGDDAVDFVVIGSGVNLVSKPEGTEYPAASLLEAGIGGVRPGELLGAYVRHFDGWMTQWREHGFAPIRAAWLARASGIGDDIRVRLERDTLSGRFLDLDTDGALLLDIAGTRRRITAGEVFPLHQHRASVETRPLAAPQDEVRS